MSSPTLCAERRNSTAPIAASEQRNSVRPRRHQQPKSQSSKTPARLMRYAAVLQMAAHTIVAMQPEPICI
jgi:hypothetical protein